jgi:RNA polymerase sigma-70 factor (ECF subfamily)
MASIALERVAAQPQSQLDAPESRASRWFSDLYQATSGRVYRFARLLTHDHFIAEDVVAETYLRVWRYRERFNPAYSELSWTMAIARNCAMDVLRERRRPVVTMEQAQGVEDTSFDFSVDELTPEQLEILRGAIGKLTLEQQQVILLRFFEGMEHERVARQMGKNANAVRAIQFRALARLRTILGGAGA